MVFNCLNTIKILLCVSELVNAGKNIICHFVNVTRNSNFHYENMVHVGVLRGSILSIVDLLT